MADEPYRERWRRAPADAPPSWLGADPSSEEARACAFCGEVPPPASSFCPKCGRALTASLMPQQGTAANVLFTDIEDSTHLTDLLGDLQWEAIIDEHNQIVREELHSHAGFEVKLTGDGFLIVFADAAQALRCAAVIQAKVTDQADRRGQDFPVRVRMGVHRGDVILRPGGDILGRTVNIASRIMAKGRGGQIMVTKSLRDHLGRQMTDDFWEYRGARRLRGLDGREHLFEFKWDDYLRNEQGAEDEQGEPDPQPEPGISYQPAEPSEPFDASLIEPPTEAAAEAPPTAVET